MPIVEALKRDVGVASFGWHDTDTKHAKLNDHAREFARRYSIPRPAFRLANAVISVAPRITTTKLTVLFSANNASNSTDQAVSARAFSSLPTPNRLRGSLKEGRAEVIVDLLQERCRGEPRLVRADEQCQVLGHEAGFDRLDADALERRGVAMSASASN